MSVRYRLVATTNDRRGEPTAVDESLHETVEAAKAAFDSRWHNPNDYGEIWLEDGERRRKVWLWGTTGFADTVLWHEVHPRLDRVVSFQGKLMFAELAALPAFIFVEFSLSTRVAVAALFGAVACVSFAVACYIQWHQDVYGWGDSSTPYSEFSLLGPVTVWLLLQPALGTRFTVGLCIATMAAYAILPAILAPALARAVDARRTRRG